MDASYQLRAVSERSQLVGADHPARPAAIGAIEPHVGLAADSEILNPSPQPIVDQLLASNGIARGVVVKASYTPNDNERVSKMRVVVRARARLADGELGPECEIENWTGWQLSALLDCGLEIPVELDSTRRLVVGIPADQLRAELEPRFDESAKRHPGWRLDPPF